MKITIKTYLKAERAANLFRGLYGHRWFGRYYKHLSAKEVNVCIKFIVEHCHESKKKFQDSAEHWYLDKPIKSKRNSPIILALIMEVNSKRRL